MTSPQRNRYKKILQAKSAELCRDIELQRERLNLDPTGDSMDRVRRAGENAVALGNIDRNFAVVRLIDRASERIREQTYGTCAHCGEDIPAKRLEAIPWSLFCVACQERAEKEGRGTSPNGDQVSYAMAS